MSIGIQRKVFVVLSFVVGLSLLLALNAAAASGPNITLQHTISEEPLLGGQVVYKLTIGNQGTDPVTDKGYNLTISETLGADLSYQSATIPPTLIETGSDGSTVLVWDNIADIEVNEEIDLFVTAVVSAGLTADDSFTNQFDVAVNTVPDNSGDWVTATDSLTASPQAIDIELDALQSTGDEQATGAGEYDGSADWPYQYRATVKNNNVSSTDLVTATIVLPANLAYMGSPTISPNPNGVSTTPDIELQADGSLQLSWALGTLTTANYANPVLITFDTAIPYRARTNADIAAASGPFAGPMSGDIIPEDDRVDVRYEAYGSYEGANTADGIQSTPADDQIETVTAEYLTVAKSVTPSVVGIDTTVTYSLNYYVSEYYTTTNVTLTDVLPDGTTYVDGSASIAPAQILQDTPGDGQTTIVWSLTAAQTTPGNSGQITFNAKIDNAYEAAPYADQPIVSGDSLTNRVTIAGEWQDVITDGRFGTAIPDTSYATVETRLPSFSKDVWDSATSSWGDATVGFTGDAIKFRLNYNAAPNVNAKEIVIRDFLPRGMTYVANSAIYTTSGNFTSSATCSAAPELAAIGTLNGLQFLEWRLCNTEQGSSWQVTLDARVSDIPDAQPGWIVANFGKLSGQNTVGDAYSLRDIATTDYVAPELVLTKTATPSTNLQPGDTVTYEIAITNRGDATAYNLVMEDVLPGHLLLNNGSGSAAPSSSSFTIESGTPVAGNGGMLEWSQVDSLAVGATQTYEYSVVVQSGVVAGQSMTNIASVSYNSRSDDTGHQWETTSSPADLNTDDETVYVRGATLTKTPDRASVTIGETMTWTLDVVVPAGVVIYWPVIEENNLPGGFEFVEGSTVLTGATLNGDTSDHSENPIYNGSTDVRWFLETIDNTASAIDKEFTLSFQTLVTGRHANGNRVYGCCNKNADNDAYIGWYDEATGYNNSGHASHSYSTSHPDRRSPEADADVRVKQPNLTVDKSSNYSVLGAGGVAVFTVRVTNNGQSPAYDVVIDDVLPVGLTLRQTDSVSIIGTDNGSTITNNNLNGATTLQYGVDVLEKGAALEIVYAVDVPADISADLEFENVATVSSYRSLPSSYSHEWVYDPVSDNALLYTPADGITKASEVDGELTVGSDIVYTLTIPSQPIPATMYNVVVTDVVDSRLEVASVSNGSHSGNNVSATFASIAPNQQEVIVIRASVPAGSAAVDGDVISNQAERIYDNGVLIKSNEVANTFVAPAFTIYKTASAAMVDEGDVVTYTITIDNVGKGTANDVELTDNLPAELQFVASSATLNGAPLSDPASGVWQLPAMAGGAQHVVAFEAQVLSADSSTIIDNIATVTGNDVNGAAVPADNSERVSADTDPDDSAQVRIYGPLACTSEALSVAYEDLKNVGWSDWDYNDVLVRMTIEQCVTPAGDLGVMQLTYDLMARGAGYDHNLRHALPLLGGGQYRLQVNDPDGSVVATDSANFGDVPDVSIFGRTWEAMPPLSSLSEPFVNTRPEQTTFVAGQNAELVIVLNDAAANPAAWLPPVPFDPYIYVYNTGEEVHLNIPGHLDNSQTVLGTFDPSSPLIGYDLPLAHTFDVNFDWPLEQFGIWRAYPQYESYVTSGGLDATSWDNLGNADDTYIWQYSPDVTLNELLAARRMNRNNNDSSYYATPVAADLNNSGDTVLIIGNQISGYLEVHNLDGSMRWLAYLGGSIRAEVATADITGDGNQEIIVGSADGTLHAYHHDGSVVSGWPVKLADYRILAKAAVANLDNAGLPEIVVPVANGRLYALNADGSIRWEASIGDVTDNFNSQPRNSSPVIVDVDDNGSLEIVVGSFDTNIYLFDANGNVQWTYETVDPIFDTITVQDIDPASAGKEIVVGVSEKLSPTSVYARSNLVVLNGDGGVVTKVVAGWHALNGSVLATDVDGDGAVELFVANAAGEVLGWRYDGTPLANWPQLVEGSVSSQPMVGDVDGDGNNEIVVTSDAAKVYAYRLDGSALTDGWPKETDVSIKGSAVVMNLDSDDSAEIVAADMSGELFIWSYKQPSYRIVLPLINR